MTAVEDALAGMGSIGFGEESRSASESVSATLEKSIPDPAKHQRSVSTLPTLDGLAVVVVEAGSTVGFRMRGDQGELELVILRVLSVGS